ncbi:hypothetical protein MMARJ_10290 [Mycobacterium marseillense]|uniref:Uncharacterized protein n=1 Tax=Mycobacterium marseillense TaxID=701042 RepID=A0ABM7J8S0_9MYCO|nr:hypothetical protein MMARJ_10290 [Mycobacterium marseillense]
MQPFPPVGCTGTAPSGSLCDTCAGPDKAANVVGSAAVPGDQPSAKTIAVTPTQNAAPVLSFRLPTWRDSS